MVLAPPLIKQAQPLPEKPSQPTAFQQRYAQLAPDGLFLPEEIQAGHPQLTDEDRRLITETLHWMHHFIMRAHETMGRSGAVCPFVRPALQRQKIFLGVCRLENPTDPESVATRMLSYGRLLASLRAREDADLLESFALLVPGMPDEVQFMEPLHQRLKTELLTLGIMPGQFYPSCPIGSTYNEDFKPLQSPAPMFVLRFLIESDWRFIQGHQNWEETYSKRFHQTTPSSHPEH
jgi:hypothetical protein